MLTTLKDVKKWSNLNSYILMVGMQNSTATLKESLQFLAKLNILLLYDIAMALFSIYSNEIENMFTKNRKLIFIEASVIIAKTWKQTRCPSVGELINWYILTLEYYSIIKKWNVRPWKDVDESSRPIFFMNGSGWNGFTLYNLYYIIF